MLFVVETGAIHVSVYFKILRIDVKSQSCWIPTLLKKRVVALCTSAYPLMGYPHGMSIFERNF